MAEPIQGTLFDAICIMLWSNLPPTTTLDDANSMAFKIYQLIKNPKVE